VAPQCVPSRLDDWVWPTVAVRISAGVVTARRPTPSRRPLRARRHMPRGEPGSLPRPLVFLDGVAAVDDDHLAGQVTALVAGKVERESTQLVWPSGPADGRVLARHQEFLAAAAVLDPARGDRVGGDAVAPEFEGERARVAD